LGVLISLGKGVPRDDVDAAGWLRKSAEMGNADAQARLGALYESGRGVMNDDEAAASWYRKSAEQGNALGQYHLGEAYLMGHGVPPSNVDAYMWLMLSADAGFKDAADRLDALGKIMPPEQIDQARTRAAEWTAQHGRR
jgi:TPR repeat protein